jgi:flagellar basal body-associated protein FliL
MNNILLVMVYVAVGLAVCAYLIRMVLTSKDRLDQRIEEFRQEQEANQGKTINPYMALAELYAEQEQEEAQRKKKRRKS